MLNIRNKLLVLAAGLGFVFALAGDFVLPPVPVAEAAYRSESDTDATILDFVENRRRNEKENARTEEQKQLLLDAYELKENLREPLDASKNVPIAVEADDLYYNEETGDFTAHGNVVLTSLDKRRLTGQHAEGNLLTEDVEIPEEGRILQLTDAQARIILNGYKTQYNWRKETGSMEDAVGKVDYQYVKAERAEFYPDKVVLYKASATKCGAKNPDYRMTAKKIEYYPGIETISYGVSYYVGSIPVYSVAKQVTKEGEESHHMPRITYDTENHFGLKDHFSYPIADRIDSYWDIFLSQKNKFKSNAGITYSTNGLGTFTLRTGQFSDSNNKWIQKSPTLNWSYGHKIGQTPFNYGLSYEHGAWSQNNRYSIHSYYGVSLSVDPVKLGTWRVYPSVNYSITDEGYNHSRVNGMGYNVTALKEFDDKLVTYLGYHYSQSNTKNSLFDYDLDSYSEKGTMGFSYTISPKDRIVIGWAFDRQNNKLMDRDYYWYHNMHCAELIVRYRSMRDEYIATLQFTPW